MRIQNRPRLVIALLVAAFAAMLGIALYAPAYIASYSTRSSTLSVTPMSYLHPVNAESSISLSNTIPQANYTGLFYVQHVCTYRQ